MTPIIPIFDDRPFEEIQEEQKNKIKKEFERLDTTEQVRLIREQIFKNEK